MFVFATSKSLSIFVGCVCVWETEKDRECVCFQLPFFSFPDIVSSAIWLKFLSIFKQTSMSVSFPHLQMDVQLPLFAKEAWACIEDAMYSGPSKRSKADCGFLYSCVHRSLENSGSISAEVKLYSGLHDWQGHLNSGLQRGQFGLLQVEGWSGNRRIPDMGSLPLKAEILLSLNPLPTA